MFLFFSLSVYMQYASLSQLKLEWQDLSSGESYFDHPVRDKVQAGKESKIAENNFSQAIFSYFSSLDSGEVSIVSMTIESGSTVSIAGTAKDIFSLTMFVSDMNNNELFQSFYDNRLLVNSSQEDGSLEWSVVWSK